VLGGMRRGDRRHPSDGTGRCSGRSPPEGGPVSTR
jgi:hypothetical protein